ncbi:PTS lactose/cellobiose transporter subunit IIA [Abyssisolibacter fermentans]|uniref:PTS lactose/cellobiose transporter subunit IIA n=1 Tax=Abyssisolibacter fermentans TaxID=1766203 RepID=UPI0008343535|nr:PTS lactose/cellobiose transporter subunit IIA [Abyssisolibacter fermentans]
MKLEEIALTLIVHAGNAKSLSFEALKEAKTGNTEKAQDLLKEAKSEFLKAHHVQTEMLQKEANGSETKVNILMVHAQDHLMGASLAMDLIEEMVCLYETISKIEIRK